MSDRPPAAPLPARLGELAARLAADSPPRPGVVAEVRAALLDAAAALTTAAGASGPPSPAESLRASEAMMAMAQRIARFGSWELDLGNPDLNANPLRWSDECYRVFGYEPRSVEVTNEVFFGRVPEEDHAAIRDAVAAALTHGHDYSIVHRVTLPGGEVRWVHEQAKVFLDDAGKPVRLVGTAHDVTERHLAHRQMREHSALLERAVEARTAELAAANRDLESFCYSVSHDLRAPVRALHAYATLLLRGQAAALDARGRERLDRIQATARRMGQLIDDLLELSRLGRRALQVEELCLDEVVAEALEELAGARTAAPVELRRELMPAVCGDRRLLKQVFINLLANALKFTRDTAAARIEIGSRRDAGELVLFVRDNGVGFDMQYAHKLFRPFERLHAQEEYEGTGVGLALVRGIVERHGGRIWAESRPGHGATFSFTLAPRSGGLAQPAVDGA